MSHPSGRPFGKGKRQWESGIRLARRVAAAARSWWGSSMVKPSTCGSADSSLASRDGARVRRAGDRPATRDRLTDRHDRALDRSRRAEKPAAERREVDDVLASTATAAEAGAPSCRGPDGPAPVAVPRWPCWPLGPVPCWPPAPLAGGFASRICTTRGGSGAPCRTRRSGPHYGVAKRVVGAKYRSNFRRQGELKRHSCTGRRHCH